MCVHQRKWVCMRVLAWERLPVYMCDNVYGREKRRKKREFEKIKRSDSII